MFDFHEKRKIKNFVYSKYSIGILLILAAWLSVSVFERYTVEREMEAKKEDKETELEALKERASALQAQVDHLENERGIEKELRSRFDVAKKGEQVIIILDEPESGTADLESLTQPPGTPKKDARESFFDMLKFW